MNSHGHDPACSTCSHPKSSHIYHEGACRPGWICESECKEFAPIRSPDRVMILPRKVSDVEAGRELHRLLQLVTPEQMVETLNRVSPGWDEHLPRTVDIPFGDSYYADKLIELFFSMEKERERVRSRLIGCDCGLIHDAYTELLTAFNELKERCP